LALAMALEKFTPLLVAQGAVSSCIIALY